MDKIGQAHVCVYVCVNLCAHISVHPGMESGARIGERRQGPWRIYSSLHVLNKETEGFNSSSSSCPFELQFLINIGHLKLHKILYTFRITDNT